LAFNQACEIGDLQSRRRGQIVIPIRSPVSGKLDPYPELRMIPPDIGFLCIEDQAQMRRRILR